MEYVYDFGDDVQHIVVLKNIFEPEDGVEYPRIVSKNNPRHRCCEMCNKQWKKTIAAWVCVDCTNKEHKMVYLCKDCVLIGHEDYHIEELTY